MNVVEELDVHLHRLQAPGVGEVGVYRAPLLPCKRRVIVPVVITSATRAPVGATVTPDTGLPSLNQQPDS